MGHPQAIGIQEGYSPDYSCDPGAMPLFGFFYRAPDEAEYTPFPGVSWQSSSSAILDTSSFTVGGEYQIQVRLRNPSTPFAPDLISDGTLLLEDP
jgi:hypothetical protein